MKTEDLSQHMATIIGIWMSYIYIFTFTSLFSPKEIHFSLLKDLSFKVF